MSEKILLVFEGKKDEPQILKNLKKTLFADIPDFELYVCHCSHIYSLYNTLKKDENLDIIELLREKNKQKLIGVSRNDIALIYLFFDYDSQALKQDNENALQTCERANKNLLEILNLFNNETEYGKLFISYPMVEALKGSAAENFLCTENRTIPITDAEKYKNIIPNKIEPTLKYYAKYTNASWQKIIKQNLRQLNWIVKYTDELMDFVSAKKITQEDIYSAEYDKFIKNEKIAVLSAFPLFIIDYFEIDFINKIME